MSELDILHEVEKYLFTIEEPDANETECNLHLMIKDAGSLIFKFRRSGNIFNRKELVLLESIRQDGAVLFKSITAFHHVMTGHVSIAEAVAQGNIETSGQHFAIELFKKKFGSKYIQTHPNHAHEAVSSAANSRATSQDHGAVSAANLTTPAAAVANANPSATSSSIPALSNPTGEPLKQGWLLKKRDIISGWKSRYFKVYPGRLDYYADQNDVHPRGSIGLVDADLSTLKPVTVKRVNEYWGVTLDTKNPDKQLKLASESTGLQGKVEADGWHQAFSIAIQSSAASKASKRSTAKKGTGANKDGNKEEADKPTDGKSAAIKEAKSLIRRVSMAPFSRDGEDKASTVQMVVYGLVIVLLAAVVHYAWVRGFVSTKLYITLSALIAVLLAIFVQEFIMVSNEPQVQTYTDAASKSAPPPPPQPPVTGTPVRASIKTTAIFTSPDTTLPPKHTTLTFVDSSDEGEDNDDADDISAMPVPAAKKAQRRPSSSTATGTVETDA